MHRLALAVALALLSTFVAAESWAVPYVYKHDQYAPDFATALAAINGTALATQPGFAGGEAFGQVFRPAPSAYPLQITGFDLILAAAPANPDFKANATIEVYNSPSTGPDPQSQPLFVASTTAIWNPQTQDFGLPLQGGIGYTVTFDLEDEQNHPPLIFSGNIFLVVRFEDAPTEATSSAWGVLECWLIQGLTCGCQGVGTLHDPLTTPSANIMWTYPAMQCGGGGSWSWSQDMGVAGDFIMRLRADVASAPCVPSCAGKACGNDGCGGDCGVCTGGTQCDQYQCVSCVPNCLSKQCGDNGCGGSCGTCSGADTCVNSWCEAPCTPECAGRVCGDDGCGGDCGDCTGSDTCNAAGKCVAPCVPSCAASNACGDDGCGASCGVCAVDAHCASGQCAPNCTPNCSDRNCGPDGCGDLCGTCAANDSCEDGVCVAPCAPSCGDRHCGDDGCSGSCGTCTGSTTCSAGQCVATCAPNCTDRACGDDGCGGSCGGCDAGATCDGGQCAAVPASLALTDVSPDFGFSGEATPISITGQGFADGVTVLVGGRALEAATRVSSQVLTGSVPAGLNPGTYTVIATNPDGASATLADAFEVKPSPTAGGKDSGCTGGGAGPGAAVVAALAGIVLALRRRRAQRAA